MKECLVIALLLSLTGMVVGQQAGSHSVFDNTRTDSTRATSPPPPRATSNSTQPDSVERIMKLDINDNMIDAIKSGQTLEATIDLQDVTNGIVMMFDDPTTLKPRVDEVPRNLEPDFVSGNGVLHFTLDEVGLERLKTEGLQYEYRPDEMGTYKQVALKFVPSSGARTPVRANPLESLPASDRRLPATNNTFGSDRQSLDRFDRANSTQSRYTNQGPLNRNDFGNAVARTDRDLSLTSAKTEADRYFEQQRLQDRQREIDRQRQVDTTRTFGIDHSRDNTKQNWDSPTSNRDTRTSRHTHTFELTDQEIDALATSTNQIHSERERREADFERMRLDSLAAERRAQQAETDRLRLMDQLRGRTLGDQNSIARRRPLNDGLYTSYGQRSLFPSDRELTRTASLDRQYNSGLTNRYSDRYPDQLAASDSRIQLKEAALEIDRLQLQLALAETTRLADLGGSSTNATNLDNTNRRFPQGMSDYGASIPGSQPQNNRRGTGNNQTPPVNSVSGNLVTVTSVDNILREYNGNNFATNFAQVAERVKGEVAAISASKNRVEKFNGFLLFLFIAFFALSLYLGWLAQSFYGQYGELADELRETFTATT